MRFSLSAVTAAAFAFSLLMLSPTARSASPVTTEAEQVVLQALIEKDIETRWATNLILFDTATVGELRRGASHAAFSEDLRRYAVNEGAGVKEALADFLVKNKIETELVTRTNALKRIRLVSAGALREIFEAGGGAGHDAWKEFYRRFPGSNGVITISRVGFDSKGAVAVVYLGRQSGPLAGCGYIRVLRREGDAWIISRTTLGPSWVS